MKFKTQFLLLLFAFIFVGCQEDEAPLDLDSAVRVFPEVDARLQDYFVSFEEEALARGFEVDLRETSISAVISEIDSPNVAGQCRYGHNTNFNSNIIIDASFFNNRNVSEALKEMVVYHELGHCFLLRGHREGAYPGGNCVSIMRSGIEDCRDGYNTFTRATYLDELFNPNAFTVSEGVTP